VQYLPVTAHFEVERQVAGFPPDHVTAAGSVLMDDPLDGLVEGVLVSPK
jgi:hypothetical protein